MTRRRARCCRCCGTLIDAGHRCPGCHQATVAHARLVADTIRELWGEQGLTQYQVALRARRLTASRTPSRRTA